jgi:hypothetical protein
MIIVLIIVIVRTIVIVIVIVIVITAMVMITKMMMTVTVMMLCASFAAACAAHRQADGLMAAPGGTLRPSLCSRPLFWLFVTLPSFFGLSAALIWLSPGLICAP